MEAQKLGTRLLRLCTVLATAGALFGQSRPGQHRGPYLNLSELNETRRSTSARKRSGGWDNEGQSGVYGNWLFRRSATGTWPYNNLAGVRQPRGLICRVLETRIGQSQAVRHGPNITIRPEALRRRNPPYGGVPILSKYSLPFDPITLAIGP